MRHRGKRDQRLAHDRHEIVVGQQSGRGGREISHHHADENAEQAQLALVPDIEADHHRERSAGNDGIISRQRLGARLPVRVRNAASPTFTPIRKTTRPAVSDGISVRSRVHTRESAISTSPAKIVMPHSSGRPPAFTASNDGAR